MEKKIIGALPIGAKLKNGSYTIERTLGQGATGITYLASTQQKLTGTLGEFSEKVMVAIKEFYFKEESNRESTTQNVVIANTNSAAKVAQFKKSFVKEAKRIAGLSHSNIVHVLEIFEENDTFYYVMQYIRGGSLKDLIEANGPISPEKAAQYASQVASALSYMHEKKMCHYDLKPGNIMLSADDNAMLIDFGISKNYDNSGQETSTTPPGLTKGYAPLEQYTSVTEFSPLIDVYSLGATLFSMLTGKTPQEPMKWISGNFPEKPENVPDSLWDIVRKAMSIVASERPTMKQMQRMLLSSEKYSSASTAGANMEGVDEETVYDDKPISPGLKNGRSSANPDNGKQVEVIIPEGKKKPVSNLLFYVAVAVLALLAGIGCYVFMGGSGFGGGKTQADSVAVSTIYDSQGHPVMTFSGTVEAGRPHGEGTLTYLNDNMKDRYEGNLNNGIREDSAAVLFFKNGDIYRGTFENDHFTIGAYYVKETGEYFQGKFKNDQPWNGAWFDKQNNVISRVEKGVEK